MEGEGEKKKREEERGEGEKRAGKKKVESQKKFLGCEIYFRTSGGRRALNGPRQGTSNPLEPAQ